MGSKKVISITIITVIIGFMIAVQFQSINKPVVRDTRDTWEIREDIKKEQELTFQLHQEISNYNDKLEKYKTERQDDAVLKETLDELKLKAGLTDVSGPGVILTVKPFFADIMPGERVHTVSPELLKRLINELNQYNAVDISIAEQRVINTTVIRDINGITKIDGYPLNRFPFEIKVIAKNEEGAEKLYNRLQVSSMIDAFVYDNLQVVISDPIASIEVPAFSEIPRIKNMKPVNAEEEEK
ncbi:DUF881 domain-containing protein [Cytobacillus sp. IB215665]|uniref:DUF881 domain-containing protein n=1 Tax=Cytobacillus sp. IB215665 TaxID=3097357 RepID=UPI002A16FDBD|nr:DUF881 domain-containing protein [Cytobacillus sp. IB215665]MDX8364976.1 DUF881 domain-containing protein [Cytobacillus sp. IB215665]